MSEKRSVLRDKRLNTIVRAIKGVRQHSPDRVFGDWCEMMALAISNSVDKSRYDTREERYLQIVKGYDKSDVTMFCELLGELTLLLTEQRFQDAFGEIWTRLELRGSTGQVWTPYAMSHLMAKMTFCGAQDLIEQHGFITMGEPCCGPGGMIVAAAHVLDDEGIDYRTNLHATGVDIDARCVHMAYVAASLFNIPAAIYRGDSLRYVMQDRWLTPAHVLGGWSYKLHRRDEQDKLQPMWQELPIPERVALLERENVDISQAVHPRIPPSLSPDLLQAPAEA